MWLDDLVRFANDAAGVDRPEHVRLAGKTLDSALNDFAAIVEDRFLHTRSRNRASIFAALAKDQLVNR